MHFTTHRIALVSDVIILYSNINVWSQTSILMILFIKSTECRTDLMEQCNTNIIGSAKKNN